VRGLLAVGALLLGLVVGLCSVALHERGWGLALVLAAAVTSAYALPAGWSTRVPFAGGWAAMTGYLAIPRGEGDYAVGSDLPGYTLLGLGVALVVAAMVTLPPRRP
jgi:hypothetical protein